MSELEKKISFVFPGQGSQSVGMLAQIADSNDVIKTTVATASEVLEFDLWQLMQEGPQESLSLTENAQPAILTASISLWRLWQQRGGQKPHLLAGHSLGEWSALVAAGVLAFEDAVKLVQKRGQYMQQAVPVGVGAMAAIIGLADELVESACAEVSGDEQVVPVNYNSPGQLVIAGHKLAVEKAIEVCKAKGAKRAMLLPVSAPFHTPLMKPAAESLAAHIRDTPFQAPSIPVIHNVGVVSESEPENIKQRLLEQIYSPVPWVACVNALSNSCTTFIECGPGKVLAGLNRRINKSLVSFSIEDEEAFETALKQCS